MCGRFTSLLSLLNLTYITFCKRYFHAIQKAFPLLSTLTKPQKKLYRRNASNPCTLGINNILVVVGHQYRFCCFMTFQRFLETGQFPIRYGDY